MSELPPKLLELLLRSDLVLFTSGGCHVFAKVLGEIFETDGLKSKMLILVDTQGASQRTLHVFQLFERIAVDALGCRNLDSLLASYASKAADGMCLKIASADMEVMFPSVSPEFDKEQLNEFNLHIEPLFVSHLEARAKLLILDNPDRYNPSLYLHGCMRLKDKSIRVIEA